MITNVKAVENLDNKLRKPLLKIAFSLNLRNVNLRVVAADLTPELFEVETLRGGDLDKLNKARVKLDLSQILESNNFQTVAKNWDALTTNKAVAISPARGQRAITSNEQIESEIMNVCDAEKIVVERLDNGQNTVYFLNLNKPKKKKKKGEDENNV